MSDLDVFKEAIVLPKVVINGVLEPLNRHSYEALVRNCLYYKNRLGFDLKPNTGATFNSDFGNVTISVIGDDINIYTVTLPNKYQTDTVVINVSDNSLVSVDTKLNKKYIKSVLSEYVSVIQTDANENDETLALKINEIIALLD